MRLDLRTTIVLVSFLVSSLTAGGAFAVPFCAVFTWGKQCEFATEDECLRAAGSRGRCEIDSEKHTPAPGAAPFCLVTPYATKCIFDDASACRFAASIENSDLIKQAKCVANPNQ